MAATDVVSSLQREVEIVKEGLKSVDENIKRLTGRDPSEIRGPVGGRKITLKRNFGERIPGPASKRFNSGSAYSRLGPRVSSSNKEQRYGQLESDGEEEEEDDQKPALQSTVVATPAPSRLKQDVVSDKKTQTRNKRMFGVLLGTLQKFKESSSKEAAQEKRRHEIEKKLEAAAEKEKEEAIRQKKELFLTRKEKQTKLENLERQMEVAEMLEEWEAHDRRVNKYIKTKAKPHIFYLPAKHNKDTLSLLDNTIKASEENIKNRRQEVEEFLNKPEKEDTEESTEKNRAKDKDVEMGNNSELKSHNEIGGEGGVRVEGRKVKVDDEELDSESKNRSYEKMEDDQDEEVKSSGSSEKSRKDKEIVEEENHEQDQERRVEENGQKVGDDVRNNETEGAITEGETHNTEHSIQVKEQEHSSKEKDDINPNENNIEMVDDTQNDSQ